MHMFANRVAHRLSRVAALERAGVTLVRGAVIAGNSSSNRKDGENKKGEGGMHDVRCN